MFINKKHFFGFLLLIMFSCSSKKEHEPGTDFSINYENNKVWKDCKFISKDDSTHYRYHCKLFYRNDKIMEEGDFLNDSFPVGWHTHYKRDGSIKSKREWWPVNANQIALNRVMNFDEKGNVNLKESNFYEIKFSKDTLKIGETVHVVFQLTAPYFKQNKLYVYLFSDNDTTPLMLHPESDFVSWSTTPSTTGKHNIHGYFNEYNVVDQIGDSLKVQGRKLYFSEDYFVK